MQSDFAKLLLLLFYGIGTIALLFNFSLVLSFDKSGLNFFFKNLFLHHELFQDNLLTVGGETLIVK